MKKYANRRSGGQFTGATLLAAALGRLGKATEQFVQVVENPQHTRNIFGPVSEIAGKRLTLLEQNQKGDCLCIFEGRMGKNIVDVDRRDIQAANDES